MASTKAIQVEEPPTNSSIEGNSEHNSLRKTQLQGGYEFLFVKDPPQELQTDCSICLCLLREPRLIDCECGSNFCRTCIEPVKVEGKPCPLCNRAFTTAFPNRQLERLLHEMQVYCSHKESGCEWKGELGGLPKHLNVEPIVDNRLAGCQYSLLKCIYCKENFHRLAILNHEANKCLQRPFSCDYCHNYESTCQDVVDNHWPVCPFRPVPCPNECDTYPERQNLNAHIEKDCPATVVECPFSYAGCEKKLPRSEVPLHISENLARHMSWQATYHQRQLKEFQDTLSLQKIHHEQQLKTAMTLQANEHHKQVQDLQESLSSQAHTSIHRFKELQEAAKLQENKHRQEIEKLRKALHNMETEVNNVRGRVKSEKETIQDQGKQIRDLSSQLKQKTSTLERENQTLKLKLEQHARTINDFRKESKSMEKTVLEVKKDVSSQKEILKSLKTKFEQQFEIIGKLNAEITIIKRNRESMTLQAKEKFDELEKVAKSLQSKGSHQIPVSASLQQNPILPSKDSADHKELQIIRIEGEISELKSEMKDTLKVHAGLIPIEVKMQNFR